MEDNAKTRILIGGGEIRSFETLELDRQIAGLAKKRAEEVRGEGARPNALFIGTASHDYMPYYNTFHKTYTGKLGLKTDVALTVFTKTEREKLIGKFNAADMVYIGGGDTLFMLESWKESGLYSLIDDAYLRGVMICGLSAGAIFWGKRMYTDSASNGDELYRFTDGMGVLEYGICPHYNERRVDFLSGLTGADRDMKWLCIENNAAAVFHDGVMTGTLSCGGKVYTVENGEEKPCGA